MLVMNDKLSDGPLRKRRAGSERCNKFKSRNGTHQPLTMSSATKSKMKMKGTIYADRSHRPKR